MPTDASDLRVGDAVYGRGGAQLGTVKRIWWPDGRIVPPEEADEGLIQMGGSLRRLQPGEGYFLLDRTLANDWFVPFSAVVSITGNRVQLEITETEAEARGWQERPTVEL